MTLLMDPAQVAERIAAGQSLILAGDGALLDALPKGSWIGGTIPYFMSEGGGLATRDKIFVTELPSCVSDMTIRSYSLSTLDQVYADLPDNGFGIIILPCFSDVHSQFALRAPEFPQFATRPLIGWIAGIHLDDVGVAVPAVYDGGEAARYTDRVVVLSAALPADRYAEIGIVNIFEPAASAPAIRFSTDGFTQSEAEIDGQKVNFAHYVAAQGLDTRLPLVADYFGTIVNTSFRAVDAAAGTVEFYAPVFSGISYRPAKPAGDYAKTFVERLPEQVGELAFSCNCILNYLYGDLDGRRTGAFVGPFTFGEVGYQLLNQTMVHLDIKSLAEMSAAD